MKKYFLFIAICISALTLVAQTDLNETLIHDGEVRSYNVHLPPAYQNDVSLPVVLNFHGYGSNNFQQILYTGFNGIADTAGFIVVYPQGLVGTTVTGQTGTHWNVYFGTGVDDLGFVDRLIDQLYTDYHIDLSRVYATGMSNGGIMSYYLACELSDRITAIASVTGTMSFETILNCDPERPIPVLQIHGTLDNVVPIDGTALLAPPIPEVIDWWVMHNNCDAEPVETDLENINTLDFSTVTKFEYGNCDENTAVHYYEVTGGGHTWPGAIVIPNLGNTNQDFDASPTIWDFFYQYSHPNPRPGTLVGTLDPNLQLQIEVYPNPAVECLWISSDQVNISGLQVKNANGQVLKSIGSSQLNNHFKMDVSNLMSGIYFLEVFTSNGMQLVRFVKT